MVAWDSIQGQEPAVETLRRALASGHVPHAYRFEGPAGVGKERAALALASALLCEESAGEGCGRCGACKRASKWSEEDPHVPQHPDLVIIERGLYPPALLGATSRESTAIGVEQIRRLVLSRAGFPPHEGRALVFIVREAHELSLQAGNALLKTLEEPPGRVHFILLTSQPNRLLDTIRSRTLAVRFGPLPEAVLARLLTARGLPAELAAHAAGSAEAALLMSDPDARQRREEFVKGALAAIAAPELDAAIVFAGARPSERDALRGELLHLSGHFAIEARHFIDAEPARALALARGYGVVREALEAVERNGQPALALEAMIIRLRAL